MGLKPRVIHVHIERLVLDAPHAPNRARIGAAVQQELAWLFATHGVPGPISRGGAFASVQGGLFRTPAQVRPSAFGTGLARAVYGGLRR
jgi:hypothetical protein